MVVIVRPFPVPVESLSEPSCLPSVEELRPTSCPLCQEPSRAEDGLQIVGHGTYQRQVLGLFGGCQEVLVRIRRFFCRACRHTISVLPDDLYPGRWYAGLTILMSLVLSILHDVADTEVCHRCRGPVETQGWKTLERWRRQILSPLWSWMAQQLGGPPGDRDQRGVRLRRLLSQHSAGADSSLENLDQVARRLVVSTAHVGCLGWEIRRGLPGTLLA